MLRSQINDIMIRWNPKERKGSKYDPVLFLETPEQARKLLTHLERELDCARYERNAELVREISEVLEKVRGLAQRFFRWEKSNMRSVKAQEIREIKKLPVGL